MGKIGSGELILILLVALLIFGPSKLPALGKMAGKAVGTLKHYADSTNWDELMEEEEPIEKEEASQKKESVQAETSETAEETKEESEQNDLEGKQAS